MNRLLFQRPLNPPSRILIVRNDRLGDTLLALPVVSRLKRSLPGSEIFFVCAPAIAPLIECVEGVDKVIAFDDRSALSHIEEIRSLNADCSICLRPSLTNALALFRVGIGARVGTARRWYSFLFNHRVNISRRQSGAHEADLNLALIESFGIKEEGSFPKFRLLSSAIEAAHRIRTDNGIESDRRLAILHPGSGGSARNWPPQYFSQLSLLLKKNGLSVAITGTHAERSLCDTAAGSEAVNLAGRTDLLTLTALINTASIFIAASTGPLHLAVALGKPVVGLYPPVADCLPIRWGPYGHPEYAITPDLPLCERCVPGKFSPCRCMEQITPDLVFDRAMKILTGIGDAN